VTLDALLSVALDEHAVAITFDDGFESFGRIAAPLLLAAGLPVTLFVVSDRVGGENDWNVGEGSIPTHPLLGWDALGQLVEAGVTIGAHTRTHPRLSRLSRRRLEDEILGSAERIEAEVGHRPRAFAYPFGDLDERSVDIVSGAFDFAVTTRFDTLGVDPDRYRMPRLDALYYRDAERLRTWGTPAFRLRVRLRRIARSARRILLGGA
jgi:peptidoglycan/xylan/chitin deacetylase (PgdA/CDA1 family)